MRYLGGKFRIAGRIARFLSPSLRNATAYYEPFVGSANVLVKVKHQNRYASDLCEPLITLHKAICDGWQPPPVVTKEKFEQLKATRDPKDPMTAFAGFGMVFGGDYFSGIARGHKGENFVQASRRSLLASRPFLKDVHWRHCSYDKLKIIPGSVVYCDPPYFGTTPYKAVGSFDHEVFWEWVRKVSKHSNVFVSEYVAPPDFLTVWSFGHKTNLRTGKNGKVLAPRMEKIFSLKPIRKQGFF